VEFGGVEFGGVEFGGVVKARRAGAHRAFTSSCPGWFS